MRYEGRFYIRGQITEACVEVDENGKINKIKKSLDSCRKIKGIVLPGAIDMHVHFREPGYEHKEDFYTGTLSAAYGGVTFIADMPNNKPEITTPSLFQEKLERVSAKANVDFTLFSMITESTTVYNFQNGLFKWYMYEMPDADIPSHGYITVHAERKECIGSGKTLREYDLARPERCEFEAIVSLGDIHRKFHIAHISSRDSVDACRALGFTCEVTPHHLLLHRDMDLGGFGKVNPPLRERYVAEMLWEDLISGRIDIVASDHAPHTAEEKADFENAPPGMPEVETYVPIFLYLVKIGRIDIKRAVEVLMSRPADIFGLNKGKIEVGYDADFIAVDFSEIRRIRERDLHYKCGWSPYDGMNAIFPRDVFIRGERVIGDGELEAERLGKFITLPHEGEYEPSP